MSSDNECLDLRMQVATSSPWSQLQAHELSILLQATVRPLHFHGEHLGYFTANAETKSYITNKVSILDFSFFHKRLKKVQLNTCHKCLYAVI